MPNHILGLAQALYQDVTVALMIEVVLSVTHATQRSFKDAM